MAQWHLGLGCWPLPHIGIGAPQSPSTIPTQDQNWSIYFSDAKKQISLGDQEV